MSVAPSSPLPADIDRLLKGISSNASVPVAVGTPSGAPGEVLIGSAGVGKIDDRAIIKSSGEVAMITHGNPRVLAYGRPISGKGHLAEGTGTKTVGGIDASDTNGCVLMTPEMARKCAIDAATLRAQIMDQKTAPQQKAARKSLARNQKGLRRAEHDLAQAKKPAKIQKFKDRRGSFGAKVASGKSKLRGFKVVKIQGAIGNVVTAAEAIAKLGACEPAAAIGGVAKSVVQGTAGGAVGTAAAGVCSGASAGIGTIACVGGGIVVGMGTSELTGDAIDWAVEATGLDSVGASIDEYAKTICESMF